MTDSSTSVEHTSCDGRRHDPGDAEYADGGYGSYRDICKPQFLYYLEGFLAFYSEDGLRGEPGLNRLTETCQEEPCANRPEHKPFPNEGKDQLLVFQREQLEENGASWQDEHQESDCEIVHFFSLFTCR
jgi:hypothetical protein